jgi:hypothetical protein
MKRKILSILFLSVTGLFILPGCSKEEDNAPAPKTKTQLLTQATWKFSTITWGGVDYTAQLPACYKDNTLTFVSNGTGTADEGPTKCNAGDPQTNAFTWSFQTNETVLTASHPLLPGGSNTFTINTLSETQLIVSQQWTPPGSGLPAQTAIVTFIH